MLNYEVKGRGPAIVLLHGYLENLKMWKPLAETLSKDYQVIMLDLPGHGKSGVLGEVHTMELMAEQVKDTLEYLEIQQALFVGHSMGGYVSLALAEKYPERVKAFVLLNSTVLPDSEEKKEQRLKAVETAQKNLDTLIKMSIPTLFAEHRLRDLKSEIELTKELARETPLKGVEAALRGMRLRPNRTSVLQEFPGKIGIVIGKYDKAVNPEELKKQIPDNGRISYVELETGHMAHLEAPEETLKFLKEFAEEVFED